MVATAITLVLAFFVRFLFHSLVVYAPRKPGVEPSRARRLVEEIDQEVMAYPFGHHNDTSKEGLRQAGFEMARTIEPGYVTVGTDKLALPTVRSDYGIDLDDLVRLIG